MTLINFNFLQAILITMGNEEQLLNHQTDDYLKNKRKIINERRV